MRFERAFGAGSKRIFMHYFLARTFAAAAFFMKTALANTTAGRESPPFAPGIIGSQPDASGFLNLRGCQAFGGQGAFFVLSRFANPIGLCPPPRSIFRIGPPSRLSAFH